MVLTDWTITKRSILSGEVRTKTFNVTDEDILPYERGELIQEAFPYLSDDDREFILTGITPEEWEDEFNDDPDIFA